MDCMRSGEGWEPRQLRQKEQLGGVKAGRGGIFKLFTLHDLRGKDCQTVVESAWIRYDYESHCTEGNKVGISKQAPRITATTVLIKVLPSQTPDRH